MPEQTGTQSRLPYRILTELKHFAAMLKMLLMQAEQLPVQQKLPLKSTLVHLLMVIRPHQTQQL